MDLGQTVVVKHLAVMAVEPLKAQMHAYAEAEPGAGGAVVVKTAKPGQDSRFDVPAVGMDTLKAMEESGCRVLAVEAERTILAEKEELLKEADRRHIVIAAVERDHD